MIHIEDISTFYPANNYVLFRPDWDNDMVTVGGAKMFIDTIFEKGMHSPVGGTVIKPPAALIYDPHVPLLDYDVDIEIQEGDFITAEFHEVFSAIENSEQRRVIVGEEVCLLIRYDRLIGARRGDEVIPLNGFVFAEALPAEARSEFEILELRKKQHHGNKAVVRYVGQKVRRYFWDRERVYDPDVMVGDFIYFTNYADVVVEHEAHRKMFDTTMFKIQRKHIIGIG